jgi:hypothetical protein
MGNNPCRDHLEDEPAMIPIYEAIRRVAQGDVTSTTIPVDSHLIISHAHRVALRIRILTIASKLAAKIETRLVVSKGRPPRGKLTISIPKRQTIR